MKTFKKSYWLRSGFFTLFEKLSVQILGFGSVFLLLRSLTKAEFGVWAIYLTIIIIIEVGRTGLLQNALVKYLSGAEKEDYPKIITASLALNFLLTSCIICALQFFAPFVGAWMEASVLTDMMRVYCITTILLIPYFFFNFIQQANLDFKGIFWSAITKQGILFGFILFTFFSDWELSLLDLAYCQIFTATAAGIVSFSFGKKYIRFSRKIDWEWVAKLFHFGKYVFGTNLSTMLYRSVDKIMLGLIPGAGQVAVAAYEAAMKVTSLTDSPTYSMANMLFPQSARRMKEEGATAIKMLYEKAVGAVMAMMIPAIIFILVFADFIIAILAGPEYAESGNLLRVTILYGLFIPFAVQFGVVLDSIGKPKINFRFTLLGMGLNVVFNYFFISQFGVFGAAYGTLTTYSIMFMMMQVVLYKELKVNALNAFKYTIEFYKKIFSFGLNFFKKEKLVVSE